LRDQESRIEYLRTLADEQALEKQQMKLVVEETLAKYRGHESSIFESESKRIELQKLYEQVI
jgi:hypothetical protein